MSAGRITSASAEQLLGRLSERDLAIIFTLAMTRVLTGEQISRVLFADLSSLSRDRARRRVLQRLTNAKVVARLERNIGGVRAGSTGWVYSLGPTGQRIAQRDLDVLGSTRIRTPWTPSLLFLKHSLMIAEAYVDLVEAQRTHQFSVSKFQTEPDCWWPDGLGGYVKPDAFLVLSTARYDELVWLEVDRSTESLPTIRRKLQAYAAFVQRGQVGPLGITPRVIISTMGTARADAIQALALAVEPSASLFQVVTFEMLTSLLIDLVKDDSL